MEMGGPSAGRARPGGLIVRSQVVHRTLTPATESDTMHFDQRRVR